MNRSTSPLLDATLKRIGEGWAEQLRVDSSNFLKPGLSVVTRDGSHSVVAVKFFDSIVVLCPPTLFHALSPLSPANVLDMDLLLQVLEDHQPNPVGLATITYADQGTLEKSINSETAASANAQDLEEILMSCPRNEQDESGVARLEFLFAAACEDGSTGAVAGYEVWNGDIAQFGVLTKPSHRGQGLATIAAHAAAKAALDAGLIPQWRCRVGNVSSYRLSQKLGFHDAGFQLAIDVVL